MALPSLITLSLGFSALGSILRMVCQELVTVYPILGLLSAYPRSFNHIAVVVSLSAEACGLRCCCLSVSKHAYHVVRPFTLKKLFAHLPWWKQKHHTVTQKAKAHSLLLGKVINVLFKLFFLSLVRWYKSHHALNRVLVNVFKVGAVRHV